MQVNSQVALQGHADPLSVKLIATKGRVYALANKEKGQTFFVLSFKVLGLEVIDERRINNERPSHFFIPIPISPLEDNL